MAKSLNTVLILLCLVVVSACTADRTVVDSNETVQSGAREKTVDSVKSLLPPGTTVEIANRWQIDDFDKDIIQFKTVFWEAEDSVSLRRLIREPDFVTGKRVLEIGTGTGLISLCCLQAGAREVVATDINPQAIANVHYNYTHLGLDGCIDIRFVDAENPGAFEVIAADEKFDLIISNPPWQDGSVEKIDDYAFIDSRFALLESILAGLDEHLTADGQALLAYGCVEAIQELYRRAPQHGLLVEKLDDRRLADLDNLFLPGMVLKVTLK